MPADFQINLAKDLTSSPEERTRFYNGFLIYLVSCFGLLVLTAYLTSVNLTAYMKNRTEQHQISATVSAATGISKDMFKHPEQSYTQLDAYSRKLISLKQLLGQRVQLLPVVHNLFVKLPQDVALQSLAADKKKVSFGLVMPMPSNDANDPVKVLRTAWESNEELMRRVDTIRPITGERRTMGSETKFYVQFECVLKQ